MFQVCLRDVVYFYSCYKRTKTLKILCSDMESCCNILIMLFRLFIISPLLILINVEIRTFERLFIVFRLLMSFMESNQTSINLKMLYLFIIEIWNCNVKFSAYITLRYHRRHGGIRKQRSQFARGIWKICWVLFILKTFIVFLFLF